MHYVENAHKWADRDVLSRLNLRPGNHPNENGDGADVKDYEPGQHGSHSARDGPLGILGFAAFEWATGGDHATVTIATPASVGNLTAISTTATAEVTAEMEKVMLAYGATRVVSGVYGAGGQPTLVVLLAQGPDTGTTSTQFFNDFASGLQSDGLTVDQTKTIAATSDGSNFVCSPASRPAPLPPVSLCGWDDGATIGLVMDVTSQPVNTTLSEAEAARRAGER